MTKRTWIALAVLIVIAAAGLGYYFTRPFELTGEESRGSQVAALPQLAQNAIYPPLRLDPYAEIQHTGVNPFGINTFLHQEVEVAKREEQVRLIRDAGFHWLRQEFPWQDIEIHGRGDFIDRRNNPDGIDAWAKYDNIVDLAEQYDLQIIARISSPPAWSRAEPEDVTGTFAPPDDYTDFANFAAALAKRYRGRITYFQVWNEPNIEPEWGNYPINPEDYTDLLCEAHDAIKAANPDAVVLSGALAPTLELQDRALNDFIFLQRMYDAGAEDCFDILSAQGYGLWSGPTDHRMRPLIVNYGRNQYLRDIMVRNGDAEKAIWISEMNWNVAPEDVEPRYGRATLDQQARWAPLAYQRAQEEWPWIGVVAFWYFKRADDQWLAERRPEAYFQMAAPDFTLMPVYDTMKTYTQQEPVLYRGSHAPDHWAVQSDDTGTRFTFEGTSLTLRYEGLQRESLCGASWSIDAEPLESSPACSGELVWRGLGGRHSVEFFSINQAEITRIIVKDKPSPRLIGLLAATALIVVGAIYAMTRRLDE